MTYTPEARPRRKHPGGRSLSGRHAEAPGSIPALERRLSEGRVSRAHRQSRLRTLLNQRNEAVGAALTDRVPVATIAALAGLKLTEVKKIGKGYADSYVSGVSREQHATGLTAIADQIRILMEEKDGAERQFRADVVQILRSGQMDVFRVASLTAVTAERLREITRGAGLRAVAFRLGPS